MLQGANTLTFTKCARVKRSPQSTLTFTQCTSGHLSAPGSKGHLRSFLIHAAHVAHRSCVWLFSYLPISAMSISITQRKATICISIYVIVYVFRTLWRPRDCKRGHALTLGRRAEAQGHRDRWTLNVQIWSFQTHLEATTITAHAWQTGNHRKCMLVIDRSRYTVNNWQMPLHMHDI